VAEKIKTEGRGDKETERQRDKGIEGQGDKETGRQRDRGFRIFCNVLHAQNIIS
jgi:hypothetical protein